MSSPATATATATADQQPAPMTHREVLEAISGILLGMFVAIMSSTVVSNALPRILIDLHGGEAAYTWVVTAALLATTASTPIWGKLSDLFSMKTLVQLSLVIFVVSSAIAGLSQDMGVLIAMRVFQGIGAGGLTALAQVVMAALIAPRERGRYSGYIGAVFATATVAGPLVGGVIVDTSWLGWRWCFYVCVPFAILAGIVVQKTLHLPARRSSVKIDYFGAALITGAVSDLLIYVTLAAEKKIAWFSGGSLVMLGAGLVMIALFVWQESRHPEPIVPLHLFANRTFTLATIASLFVGIAMFGSTVFLGQYFQISRGESPTASGLMSIPMIFGLFLSSTLFGRRITTTGRWKAILVWGTILFTIGFALMSTITADMNYWVIAPFMFVLGAGIGMAMQNLVLAVQNTLPMRDMGSGSSAITFFRSLGGAIGVSVLGAVLSTRVVDYISEGVAAARVAPAQLAQLGDGTAIPDVHTLAEPLKGVVQNAYGNGVADVFLVVAPLAFLAFLAVIFIKEVPLRTTNEDTPPVVVDEDKQPVSV